MAKYNEVSQGNRPSIADDGLYRYVLVRGGNNSNIISRVLKGRSHWVELD